MLTIIKNHCSTTEREREREQIISETMHDTSLSPIEHRIVLQSIMIVLHRLDAAVSATVMPFFRTVTASPSRQFNQKSSSLSTNFKSESLSPFFRILLVIFFFNVLHLFFFLFLNSFVRQFFDFVLFTALVVDFCLFVV